MTKHIYILSACDAWKTKASMNMLYISTNKTKLKRYLRNELSFTKDQILDLEYNQLDGYYLQMFVADEEI